MPMFFIPCYKHDISQIIIAENREKKIAPSIKKSAIKKKEDKKDVRMKLRKKD